MSTAEEVVLEGRNFVGRFCKAQGKGFKREILLKEVVNEMM